MPTQDWYRPGKGYLRRDAAKFRYTKRNVKMTPPFSCSQKLVYCDTNEDLLPDRILKNYRNPALKKRYTCPLRPANGPESLEGILLAPKNGPLSLVSNIPPKVGISTLSSILNLPTEASGEFDLSTKVDAPAAITNVTTSTLDPIEGVSTLTSTLEIPKETSGDFDLSTKIHNPPGIIDLSTDIKPPVSISGLTSSLLKPSAVSDLETKFLEFVRDLQALVKRPSAVSDLTSSLGVSSPVTDLLSTLKQPESFGINLTGSIKRPTAISDLSIRRPAGFSMGLSAFVVRPSPISDLSIRRPAAFSNGLTAELNKPGLIGNLTAEIKEPWFGVSNLSSATPQPHTITPFTGSEEDFGLSGVSQGYFVIPFNVGTAASTWRFHLDALGAPDRFQILYDTSGASNVLDNCEIVADSLFVGDTLSETSPARTTYSLSRYAYVGTQGDAFDGKFLGFGEPLSTTITDEDCAPLTGFRTDSVPNGGNQFGVVNGVYRSFNDEPSTGLLYKDGNICLEFSKTESVADRAYLIIIGVGSTSSLLVKTEKL